MLSFMQGRVPLSLFWFLYLGAQGIFFPYYSLYLKENARLSGTEVGLVLAIIPLVEILAQTFFGQVADRSGARSRVLTLLSFGASVSYMLLGLARGFPAILLATGALAIFATTVIPMTVSVTLGALGSAGPNAFGFIRVWGTLGFLLLVLLFPWILGSFQAARGLVAVAGEPSEPGLEIMFLATAVLAFLAALVSLALPREGMVAVRAARGDWRSLLYNKAVRRFLLFSFGVYFLLQGPMWLFPVYVRSRGGDLDTIRWMWVLMLLVEIPLVLSSGSALKRLGARGLLGLGVLAGALRWTVSGMVEELYLVYAVQMLHGVMVAGLLLGGPLYLDAVIPARLRSTGQALLTIVGVAAGGIASNAAAGWLLEHVGPNAPYVASGLGAFVLGSLVWWIVPPPEVSALDSDP
jgi:PPP family 3-phenylpropionic acid transporter